MNAFIAYFLVLTLSLGDSSMLTHYSLGLFSLYSLDYTTSVLYIQCASLCIIPWYK